jgi:hypothetical protein
MPIQSDGPAPYTSPSAVIAVAEAYRRRGLQTPITLDVLLRVGVTDTLAPRTLQSLRLLDLIDEDGEPTPAFVEFRKAAEDEYRDRFAAILRGAYAEVFSYVDPAEDGPDRVRDAFRSYTPIGQQGRMVTLFLGLCAYAGIVPEDAPTRAPSRTGRQSRPRPATAATGRIVQPRVSRVSHDNGQGSDQATVWVAPLQAGGHPLVQGLLRELPPVGAKWSAEKRKAWLELAAGILNVLYESDDEAGGGD